MSSTRQGDDLERLFLLMLTLAPVSLAIQVETLNPAHAMPLRIAHNAKHLPNQAPVQKADLESAIKRSFKFLAVEQIPDGSWSTSAWGPSTGATGLALLAFFSAGHLPDSGPYGHTVAQGVEWILSHQQPNGLLVNNPRSEAPLMEHGICTLMLAELIGMQPDMDSPKVRRSLERSIRTILEYQQKDGGWSRHGAGEASDLAAVIWQIMALRSARQVGCDVPGDALNRAAEFIRSCRDSRTSGFGARPGHGPTASMTAAAITGLELCEFHSDTDSLAAAEWLASHPLHPDSEYLFFGACFVDLALFQLDRDTESPVRKHLAALLLNSQHDDGGWTPRTERELAAGRAYCTSLAVLALTTRFRLLPVNEL